MKYLLLYNPTSGKGKFENKIPYIKEKFEEKDLFLTIYRSKGPKDLIEKAKLEAANYDYFLVAGGDGTVNEVLNGIMVCDKKPVIAILPSGTANDTASILGVNKSLKRILKLIFENKPILMDINKINDKYFIYTTAAGILTKISYDVDREEIKKYGYIAYLKEGAIDLIKDYNIDVEVIYDHGVVKGQYMLVLGLSAKRVGGINLWRFSNAKLNDGLFEIRLIKYKKGSKLFRLLSFFLLRGRKYRTDAHLKSSNYQINVDNDIIWNTDGEKGESGSVKIEVIKESLAVIASKRAKRIYFNKK